jgi:hypothetical protein
MKIDGQGHHHDVTGRYAEKPQSDAGVELGELTISQLLDVDPGMLGTYSEDPGLLDDAPPPQANSPEQIALAVDAVAQGCATAEEIADALGYDHRQGGYYGNAGVHLGLLDVTGVNGPGEHRIFTVTPLGVEFAAADPETRSLMMAEAMEDSPFVNAYLRGGENAVVAMLAARRLAPVTQQRRVSTVQTWARYAGEDLDQLADHMRHAAERAPTVTLGVQRVVSARVLRRDTQIQRQKCGSCGLLIPLAMSECEYCG